MLNTNVVDNFMENISVLNMFLESVVGTIFASYSKNTSDVEE